MAFETSTGVGSTYSQCGASFCIPRNSYSTHQQLLTASVWLVFLNIRFRNMHYVT